MKLKYGFYLTTLIFFHFTEKEKERGYAKWQLIEEMKTSNNTVLIEKEKTVAL